MITEKKVKIYEKFDGFVEAYMFKNRNSYNKDFDSGDWIIIDELIGNIILLKNKNISDELRKKLEDYIVRHTESNQVTIHLEALAEKNRI